MRQDDWHFEAIAETTSFLRYFNDLPDYRQAGKVDYETCARTLAVTCCK